VSRLEFVALDLMKDDGWAAAMKDVRYLCHVASPLVTVMPKDKYDLIRPAVEGTTRALEAAFAAKVDRVVMTASISAIMYGHDRSRTAPFTAADWTNLESPDINAYIESKTRSEQAAWEIAKKHGRTRDLVCINPGAVMGPLLDDDAGTTAAFILRMLSGKVPALPKICLIVTDVRDVAEAHVVAFKSPEAGGHRFPIGTDTMSMMEIAKVVGKAMPTYVGKLPKFELPDWVVRVTAPFDKELRGNLCELGYRRSMDHSAVKKLLGHPLTPSYDTIADTGKSMVALNLV
jgi:dihydroflavonol-4-reductase